jgi:hypothetical protein
MKGSRLRLIVSALNSTAFEKNYCWLAARWILSSVIVINRPAKSWRGGMFCHGHGNSHPARFETLRWVYRFVLDPEIDVAAKFFRAQ